MKKIFLYITIIIALTGIFGLKTGVLYAQVLGTCQDSYTVDEMSKNVPRSACPSNFIWVPNPPETSETYTPLAPLPFSGLDGPINTQTSETNACPFGKYMNSWVTVLTGMVAVFAVVMIVLGGMQYMTSELLSSKEGGKEKIRNAFLGIAIALGAYALLWTINPQLIDLCFNVPKYDLKVPEVEIETHDGELPNSVSPTPGTPYPVTGCPEGIVDVNTKSGTIRACQRKAAELKAMVDLAFDQGIRLTGGGWRSPEEQRAARRRNGCPADDSAPSRLCTGDPVACVGCSNHQRGLAVDFRCNGRGSIRSNDVCSQWLRANAATFGYRELVPFRGSDRRMRYEPWHWSVDGR